MNVKPLIRVQILPDCKESVDVAGPSSADSQSLEYASGLPMVQPENRVKCCDGDV